MLRNLIAGMGLAILAGVSVNASAETVTYSFQGYVNGAFIANPSVPGGYATWYPGSTSASGDFTIALPAVDSDSSPNTGSYTSSPVISGDLKIGTDTILLNSSDNSLTILNDSFDQVEVKFDGLQLFLQDSTGTALSSDAIPTSLSFSEFDSATFSFSTADFSHFINGSVTALSASVDNSPPAAPLPASAWSGMILMGCIAAERFRRRFLAA